MISTSGPTELLIKNPHSILSALQHRPQDVLEVTLPRDKGREEGPAGQDHVWKVIEQLARRENVKVKEAASSAIDGAREIKTQSKRDPRKKEVQPRKEFIGRESTHGAMIRPKKSLAIEELFQEIDANTRGVWLALDCLQDPQNLGAIFRSAAFFGVKGLIMTSERSAPMTQTVYDISAGGVETLPFVTVINLQRAFEVAKKSGMWILGTSEHAKDTLQNTKNDRPWLIVVGNEEKGMRRLTAEACDVVVSVPARPGPNGKIGVSSLNVSVATGVILSHFS